MDQRAIAPASRHRCRHLPHGFRRAGARPRADPAYIVVDADSGAVLSDSQSDALWHPASLTKLMTAYVTFEALKAGKLTMTSPVRISAHALAQAPAKMGFKVGTIVNVDNALKMMLVKSANDIAVAIAETVGGSEPGFVARMNATAARLGMASTHYDNANGLPDDGQTTTARDLAVLAKALLTDFPEYRSYFGIPAIKAGKRILRSENALLERYRGTTGMKTGFICASGYNIVATAHRGARSLIAVVLGGRLRRRPQRVHRAPARRRLRWFRRRLRGPESASRFLRDDALRRAARRHARSSL
ncbi:MAG: D-alanyl-D-alanine carboxypeptidase family protein [Bauldia sp.]